MKFNIFIPAAAFFIFTACGGMNVVPEKDLADYPVKKIMELGAENYSSFKYEESVYYYSEVIRMFTNDTEENLDARAWSKYEIGFIRYVQGRNKEAEGLFDEVLSYRLANKGPQILAA